MEIDAIIDAIIEVFHRSESLHKIKYTQYIGDGDSKTFKGILDAQPYENLVVRKKKCIDHIQKRLGARFRALKIHEGFWRQREANRQAN